MKFRTINITNVRNVNILLVGKSCFPNKRNEIFYLHTVNFMHGIFVSDPIFIL